VPCLESKILRNLIDHAPQVSFSINGLNDYLNNLSTHLITGTKYLNIGRKACSPCVFLGLIKGVRPTEKPSSPRKTEWWLTSCARSSPICFTVKKREEHRKRSWKWNRIGTLKATPKIWKFYSALSRVQNFTPSDGSRATRQILHKRSEWLFKHSQYSPNNGYKVLEYRPQGMFSLCIPGIT
jgi:hypothetical protein